MQKLHSSNCALLINESEFISFEISQKYPNYILFFSDFQINLLNTGTNHSESIKQLYCTYIQLPIGKIDQPHISFFIIFLSWQSYFESLLLLLKFQIVFQY